MSSRVYKYKKRFFRVLPILALLLQLLAIDDVRKTVNLFLPTFYVAIFIVAATILTFILSSWSPLDKYDKLKENSKAVLQGFADKIVSDYPDYQFNVNIMYPRRRFLFFIEPKSATDRKEKFSFTGKVFKLLIESGEKAVDKRLRLTINQGTAGIAMRQGRNPVPRVHDNSADFFFSDKQLGILEDIKFVCSVPITSSSKAKVIGVVNCESCIEASKAFLGDDTNMKNKWQEIEQKLRGLSDNCSKLLDGEI